MIIVGHTRGKAAGKLGLAKVPVHVAKDFSEAQIKAYRIADNQTASIAEWDFDLLGLELLGLKVLDYDLTLLGFDADELAQLLDREDEVGQPPVDGPTHREARRVGRASHPVLVAGRRERAGFIRGER